MINKQTNNLRLKLRFTEQTNKKENPSGRFEIASCKLLVRRPHTQGPEATKAAHAFFLALVCPPELAVVTLFFEGTLHLGCTIYRSPAGSELETSSLLGSFKVLRGRKAGWGEKDTNDLT